jgi:hypothetical protein
MNCPVRTDPAPDEGHNQNPSDLANEMNTNNSLNHRKNSTQERNRRIHLDDGSRASMEEETLQDTLGSGLRIVAKEGSTTVDEIGRGQTALAGSAGDGGDHGGKPTSSRFNNGLHKLKKGALKYFKFMGPGLMVSVAYIDPGMLFLLKS